MRKPYAQSRMNKLAGGASRAGRSVRLTLISLIGAASLALMPLSAHALAAQYTGAAIGSVLTQMVTKPAVALEADGDVTRADYRGYRRNGLRGRHHYKPFHRKFNLHPGNIKRLYPYKYRYHTPPRRYRYACAYDRWGNSHPEYRRHCDGIGRHYYVPKNFYRKHRHYRGHPYMRRQLHNLRRRWY